MVIERLIEPYNPTAILRVSLVKGFYDVPLSLGRIHVFLDWLDDLHTV